MRKEFTRTGDDARGSSEADLEERVFSKFPIFRELKQIAVQVPGEEWNEMPADLAVNLDHYP